ncbi:MAG: hypothetical protein ACRDZ2_04980 [Ilumatobacteraceae bacterium]
MTLIGYDPERVRVLHRLAGRTIDALDAVRTDDLAAVGAMTAVRTVRRDLDETCLRLTERVLVSDAMRTFGAIGLVPIVGPWLEAVLAGPGEAGRSVTDRALIRLLEHFAELDRDGDGALSGVELFLGRYHADASVRRASEHLVTRSLVMRNVGISDSRWADHDGGDDVSLADISIDATDIAHALQQNEVLRVLADPARFAAIDGWRSGVIDGLISADDVRAYLDDETDPTVRGPLEVMLASNLLARVDREFESANSDGTIAYDQVYALGVHQGAWTGLADPAVPAALRPGLGPPERTGDPTPQFLHHPITPQPGLGQVTIALYIPSERAGLMDWDWAHSTGNGRGPDPDAHPSDSKGWAVVDYETGLVSLRINPSCSGSDAGVCEDPLPTITDFGDVGYLFQRVPLVVADSNRARVVDGRRTKIQFGIINSDKRFVAPRLDATFHVEPNDDATVSLEWDRNAFPAMEAYHRYPDGRIVPLADGGATDARVGGRIWDWRHGSSRG